MAGKLDVYVSIHLHLCGFGTDELAPVKYIFVDSQMEKAIALKNKLDAFKDEFDRHVILDIRVEQGLVFVSEFHCPT